MFDEGGTSGGFSAYSRRYDITSNTTGVSNGGFSQQTMSDIPFVTVTEADELPAIGMS